MERMEEIASISQGKKTLPCNMQTISKKEWEKIKPDQHKRWLDWIHAEGYDYTFNEWQDGLAPSIGQMVEFIRQHILSHPKVAEKYKKRLWETVLEIL